MRTFILLSLVLLVSATLAEEFNESEKQFEEEFNILVNDETEEEHLAENLKKAEEQINEDNKEFEEGKSTYKEKLYPDSNLDKDEFEKEKEGAIMPDDVRTLRATVPIPNGIIMPPESERSNPESDAYLRKCYNSRAYTPSSYDARQYNLVTKPKNQMSCGSCAAFSATGLHETCMRKAGAPLNGLDLSEQHLVDCGYDGNSMNGCNGAWVHAYQKWYKQQGGQGPHEATEPYLNDSPLLYCPNKAKWNSGAKVSDVAYDYSCNADKLKQLVYQHGAVSVAIYASDSGFGNYASGVFQGCSSTQINHAVLVVGYGTENGVPYWLVKNSWGDSWGDNGYIKMRRGTNECGIEGMCVVADCSDSGNASPAPAVPPAPPIPVDLWCDISGLYGRSDITGTYNLRITSNGKEYNSEVKCENSNCTPKIPGPSNACMYICGKTKC